MPLLPPSQSVYTRTDALAFLFLSTGGAFAVGVYHRHRSRLGRLGVIGALAFAQWLRSRRRERKHSGEQYEPFVSIIVPAYNCVRHRGNDTSSQAQQFSASALRCLFGKQPDQRMAVKMFTHNFTGAILRGHQRDNFKLS